MMTFESALVQSRPKLYPITYIFKFIWSVTVSGKKNNKQSFSMFFIVTRSYTMSRQWLMHTCVISMRKDTSALIVNIDGCRHVSKIKPLKSPGILDTLLTKTRLGIQTSIIFIYLFGLKKIIALNFKDIFFIFIYVWGYIYIYILYIYIFHQYTGGCGGQKRVPDPLELELGFSY
uniref:Uncharacterized protein n=1 Tax=Mus musculus TaxID=10090 RepID=Q8C5V9_MOUSE|nr:unnamed protein product [Mus musculus]